MKVGLIGLGRMGNAIANRLLRAGYQVIGFDYDSTAREALQSLGGSSVATIAEVCHDTSVVWLMVPVPAVDEIMAAIIPHVRPDTIIIDGGNSYYKDSIRRALLCEHNNIDFLDCGTSGGIHGREHGFCLMVGGKKQAYTKIYPVLSAIAAPQGVAHVGQSGTGHYVKMVHNGIEYGLLQAYAEGFQLIKEGSFKDAHLDLAQITQVWNNGSIIRSWILQLAQEIFTQDQTFDTVIGRIEELGTGQWTLQEGKQQHIPTPVLEESLKVRAWSRNTGGNYATKIIALLRNKFGGHPIKKKE
jgi:6-phosphogluconate dehydrogenase